jgi:septal ring factor EnvC (AmiA/AmiB activator)
MNTPPPIPIVHAPAAQPAKSYKWFWVYAIVSSGLILFLLLKPAIAPPGPRESMENTRERTAEGVKQARLARIEGLERQRATWQQTLAQTEAEKASYQTKVNDYAMDHKMAILAIGGAVAGTAIALDKGNNFTDDQKTVAGWTAAFLGLYALSNHEEIIEVTDRMTKAAAMIADYDKRIAEARKQLSSVESQLAQEKTALN